MNKDALYGLIIGTILGIALSLAWGKSFGEKTETVRIDTTYIKGPEVTREIAVAVPGPRHTIERYFYRDSLVKTAADTARILADYFREHTYQDTISFSQSRDTVSVYLTEKVLMNRITDRKFTYNWRETTTVVNKTEIKPSRNIYLGSYVNGSQNRLGLGPAAMIDLNRATIGGGYDLLNREAMIQAYFKINTRRK